MKIKKGLYGTRNELGDWLEGDGNEDDLLLAND